MFDLYYSPAAAMSCYRRLTCLFKPRMEEKVPQMLHYSPASLPYPPLFFSLANHRVG
jgi:hypothetical protein